MSHHFARVLLRSMVLVIIKQSMNVVMFWCSVKKNLCEKLLPGKRE